MTSWDRSGKPMSMMDWVLRINDAPYRILASTRVDADLVVTIWLGVAHGFDHERRPLIFETAVYENGSRLLPHWTRHYATEQDARHGHREVCRKIRAGRGNTSYDG